MTVILSRQQAEYAVSVAEARRAASQNSGLQNSEGFKPERGLKYDIMGACGEIAAAVALGITDIRLGVNTFKSMPDIIFHGFGVEVRTTASDRATLYFRQGDAPTRAYVLVRERKHAREYDVHGWTYPEIDKPLYILGGAPGRNPTPCVEHVLLRPIQGLKTFIERITEHDEDTRAGVLRTGQRQTVL